MGQYLSALKVIRSAGRNAQSPSVMNGPKDEHDVSSRDEIHGVLCSLNEIALQSSHTNPELVADTLPMTLLKLPTEIILDLAELLPPSGYMSLSYSCRQIRNNLNASIAHVLGDKPPMGRSPGSVPSVEIKNIRLLERLELRCMLNRDGKLPSSKRFCPMFLARHDISFFSKASLAQLFVERRCLGSAGLVWICPHRTLNDYEAERKNESEISHTCQSSRISTYDCGYMVWWPIVRLARNGVPSKEQGTYISKLILPFRIEIESQDMFREQKDILVSRLVLHLHFLP